MMLEWLRKLGLPDVASAHGPALDEMLAWIHWLMLILFIGWGAYYILTVFRFRSSKQKTADYKGVTNHYSSYIEVTVAILEIVLIVGFAMPLWAQRVNQFPSEKEAIRVRVIAQQFAWNVHYAGKDGIFGRANVDLINEQSNPLGLDREDKNALDDITTINQLHLPVSRPVIIELTSKDVIHSFGIPEMRVKQDAIPGLMIPLWFTPTVTTKDMRARQGKDDFNYQIACAQLCGNGHSQMRGFTTIHSQAEFEAWLSNQEPALGSGDDGGDFWE